MNQIFTTNWVQGLAWATTLLVASQTCMGTEIYRWVDAAGRTHFSDTPPSIGKHAPLRPTVPAPVAKVTSSIPDDHYSVINQVKRFENNRRERRGAMGASMNEGPRAERGRRVRARGSRDHVGASDWDYAGYDCCSNLGPRTDLIKFPPPGHPVYSPTLGFPPNKHPRKAHRRGGRLSAPLSEMRYARPARGGYRGFRR